MFLLIAIFIFLAAERRTCYILPLLDLHNVAGIKPARIRLLSWALVLATLALGCAIWLLVRKQPFYR